MSTQSNHKTDVKIPTQPQRGGDKPLGAPTNRPSRGRLALAITTVVAAGVAVTALWMSVGSGSETQVPNPGVEPFVSQVPQGIDGSDWRLHQRANELRAEALARQESAFGSDRRLLQQGVERATEQKAWQESAFGSDRRLYNMGERLR